MPANLIHYSKIKIEILDRSAANYDTVFKRPKGNLPASSTLTVWGQMQALSQQERREIEQGDSPRVDGYVYVEKPAAATVSKGDRIVEIDDRTYDAKIVEVRDETVYYDGPDWTRLDFQRKYDVSV
jgi:hypothetical protein